MAISDHGPYSISSTSSLVAFESSARHGNFSKAATELATSQSAVSRRITQLEKQFSVRLFERSRTGVRLTEAGQRFLDAVDVGLGAFREGAAEVAAMSDGEWA